VIAHPVAIVTFPSFAKSNSAGVDIRPPFLRVLGMIALVACPIGIIMSAAAEPFTRALFGPRWLPMIGPLTVMGLWAAVRQIDTTIGWLLNSLGRAGAVAWLSVFVLPPLIGGCIFASQIGGLTAVAFVPLADTLLSAAIGSVLAKRFIQLTYRAQWRALRPALIASVPTWFVTRGIGQLLGPTHPLVALPLAVLGGLLIYAGLVSLLDPGVLRETIAQAKRMLRQPPTPTAST
jgi:O-antigen/teichoic acid export membrane protein